MTTTRKPVRRETPELVRDAGKVRPLIVELWPSGIAVYQKRSRHSYLIPYRAIYDLGVKLFVEAGRRQKRQRRERKRK